MADSRSGERFDDCAYPIDIVSGSSVVFLDNGPVVIRFLRLQPPKLIRERISTGKPVRIDAVG